MQLHGTSNPTLSNLETSSCFKIKTTAKAFKILSDGLYSDKVLAVIRELSCNAYDAHVAAGKPNEKFVIQLPTRLDPVFAIEDFGTGLSEEDILNLYTTYFDSNKSDSNEFVGALGLGSKSPFSYTDSFKVVSTHDGTRKTYLCYLADTGVPSVSKLTEENVDLSVSNGLRVEFAVGSSDFSTFEYKAKSVYYAFKNPPLIDGEKPFTYLDKTHTRSGDGWFQIADSNLYVGAIELIQGNIKYPFNHTNFLSLLKNPTDRQRKILETLYGFSTIIEFPLGELDVAASREAISYDQQTIINILKRFEKVYNELILLLEKEIGDASNYIEACIRFKKIDKQFFRNNRRNVVPFILKYKDKELVSSINLKDVAKEKKLGLVYLFKNIKIFIKDWEKNKARIDRKFDGYIHFSENIIVILNDLKEVSDYRLSQIVRDHLDRNFHLGGRALVFSSVEFCKEVLSLEKKDLVKLSDLEQDFQENRPKKDRSKLPKVFRIVQGWDFNEVSFEDLKEELDSKSEDKIYIPIFKKNFHFNLNLEDETSISSVGKYSTAGSFMPDREKLLNIFKEIYYSDDVYLVIMPEYEVKKKRFENIKDMFSWDAFDKMLEYLRNSSLQEDLLRNKKYSFYSTILSEITYSSIGIRCIPAKYGNLKDSLLLGISLIENDFILMQQIENIPEFKRVYDVLNFYGTGYTYKFSYSNKDSLMMILPYANKIKELLFQDEEEKFLEIENAEKENPLEEDLKYLFENLPTLRFIAEVMLDDQLRNLKNHSSQYIISVLRQEIEDLLRRS